MDRLSPSGQEHRAGGADLESGSGSGPVPQPTADAGPPRVASAPGPAGVAAEKARNGLPPVAPTPAYTVAEKALRRWVEERLRRRPRPGGGSIYWFSISGSTCNNMGLPLEAVMTVELNAEGRIESAFVCPEAGDPGWAAMCGVGRDPAHFSAEAAGCPEAIGLSLHDAAFRDWSVETSGCFCTPGNRRHKWRNAFQALHYAETHPQPPLPSHR